MCNSFTFNLKKIVYKSDNWPVVRCIFNYLGSNSSNLVASIFFFFFYEKKKIARVKLEIKSTAKPQSCWNPSWFYIIVYILCSLCHDMALQCYWLQLHFHFFGARYYIQPQLFSDILNSLNSSKSGANALFKDIFGLTEASSSAQSMMCFHSSDSCLIGSTCL